VRAEASDSDAGSRADRRVMTRRTPAIRQRDWRHAATLGPRSAISSRDPPGREIRSRLD
jgi:hypothetical protein